LADFKGVGQTAAEVIAGGSHENLGFVGQTAEGLGVDDAVLVTLEMGPPGAGLLIN
jgi:hypothetical protein